MSIRITGVLTITLGLLTACLSALADVITNEPYPEFGLIQALGIVAGIVVCLAGIALVTEARNWGSWAYVWEGTRNGQRRKEILQALAAKVIAPLGATLFALIVAELVARIIFPAPRFDPRLPFYPYLNQIMLTDLRGVSQSRSVTTNEWGFRGDPPPDNWDETYTIVTIGGSTTRCSVLDDANTWPAVLQDNLREEYGNMIWVGNAGVDGQTTRGHILVMEDVIGEIRPDAVVFLVGVNDLGLSLAGEVLDAFDNARNPVLFESQLYAFFWRLDHVVIRQAEVVGDHDSRNLELQPVEEDELTPLPDDLAEMLPSLASYGTNLERIVDIAEELGVEPIFLTQPLLFADTPYWEGIEGTHEGFYTQDPYVSAATFARMLDMFNQELLDVCEEREVACYDLANRIPHSQEYYFDEMHYNDAGARLVGEEVAHAVSTMLLDGQ